MLIIAREKLHNDDENIVGMATSHNNSKTNINWNSEQANDLPDVISLSPFSRFDSGFVSWGDDTDRSQRHQQRATVIARQSLTNQGIYL